MVGKIFFWLLATRLLTPAPLVAAQQPTKVPRIGFLFVSSLPSNSARIEAFRQGLRELDYIEGKNIAIEYRHADGKRERFPALATELVRLKVDLIVVAGGDALIQSVMNATKIIPIVMTGGGADPVEAGFVQSLARPGRNATGIALLVLELGGKRGWSCSKRPFPRSPVSRLSTSPPIPPVYAR